VIVEPFDAAALLATAGFVPSAAGAGAGAAGDVAAICTV
jgi:hypothetical protein